MHLRGAIQMGRGGVIPMSVWIGLEVSLRMERVVFLVPL
jgi:hypothetical protein